VFGPEIFNIASTAASSMPTPLLYETNFEPPYFSIGYGHFASNFYRLPRRVRHFFGATAIKVAHP